MKHTNYGRGFCLGHFLFSNLDSFLAFTPGKAFFVYFFRKATCAENLHYGQAPLPEISFRPLKLKRCAELDEAARLRIGSQRLALLSGQTRLSVDETALRCFSSGQNGFSPDETSLRWQNHDLPDGRPMRLAHQNHFGSQCATESVYWHLPAKVKLKKSHFGKPPLTECALRHPPCQSELAELRERQKPATKSKNDAWPSASRQYTPRAMPSTA